MPNLRTILTTTIVAAGLATPAAALAGAGAGQSAHYLPALRPPAASVCRASAVKVAVVASVMVSMAGADDGERAGQNRKAVRRVESAATVVPHGRGRPLGSRA